MESCLVCLEMNKDILDPLAVNSTKWQELNVTQLIEKHLWPLNTIQSSCWICSTCWKELHDFHKFYTRIEEAHMNFGRIIKVENETQLLDCKDESINEKLKIKNSEDGEKDNFAYCCIEPEILIDQPLPPEALAIAGLPPIKEPSDEDGETLEHAYKRVRLENGLTNKDPLEKSKKSKVTKIRSRRSKTAKERKNSAQYVEESKVKLEPADSNGDGSGSDADPSYEPDKDLLQTAENQKRKTFNKHRSNDKFVADYFKQMFCDLCQAPFEEFPAIQKHFTEIHQQSGYVVCCNKKFYHRNRLVDHIHCHLNPDYFKCTECGKVLSDRIYLKRHMALHKPNDAALKHCCEICGKSFTKAYVLKAHKLTHLPKEERHFPCTGCGKRYGSAYLLKLHMEVVHLKKLAKVCYICGKSIGTSTEYKAHIRRCEGTPTSFISCDICGLRLTSERGLKLHKESQHPVGGKQEHCCSICPKVSPTLRALKKHINTMHEKGYEYKCTMCEKSFKRSERLKEHMATHTGTSLYTCPWCPKTFNSNGNMHAHRKNIHPYEWAESKLQKYSGNLPPQH